MRNNKHLAMRIASLFICIAAILTLLAPQAAAAEPEQVAAGSAILIEPNSGTVLYEYNANTEVMPASTTKIMTALLVIEAAQKGQISLDDEVMATQSIIDGVMYDASKVSPYIADGEVMTVRSYLYAVLLSSDCVACDILGNYISGSVEGFVELMNTRARELGCTNTLFLNAHGYPVDGHYSTAADLARIAAEAIKYETFTEIFGTIKYQLPATNLNSARKLYNTNWLLWDPEQITSIYCKYYYEYATGGKTGSSNKSGHCLVSTAEKDGMELICVVTGCEIANPSEGEWQNMSFIESAKLFEWGFNNFTHVVAVAKGSTQAKVSVRKSDIDEMGLVAAESLQLTIPTGTEALVSTEAVVYEKAVRAPVSAGDVMGEVKVSYNGELVGTVKLIASREIPLNRTVSPIIIILIILVAAVAAVMLYVINSDDPVILKQLKPYSTYRKKSSRPVKAGSAGTQRPVQQQYRRQLTTVAPRTPDARTREQHRR